MRGQGNRAGAFAIPSITNNLGNTMKSRPGPPGGSVRIRPPAQRFADFHQSLFVALSSAMEGNL